MQADMRVLRRLLGTVVLGFALVSWGGESRGGEGVVGLWERELRNDAGPNPIVLLELRANGAYILHGAGWMSDRGHYEVAGKRLLATFY